MKNKAQIAKRKKEENYCAPSEGHRLITELVAELAIVLNDKATLENENSTLKLQCQELQHKLVDTEKTCIEEKDYLLEDIKASQEKIQEVEKTMVQNNVHHKREHQKMMIEVDKLKAVYYKQKELISQKEKAFKNEINTLKEENDKINEQFKMQKETANNCRKKCLKYKSKLTYAVDIINILTATLAKHVNKSITFNKKCQTPPIDEHVYETHTSSCSLHSHCIVETEKIILSELFFKQYPTNKELEVFFNESDDLL